MNRAPANTKNVSPCYRNQWNTNGNFFSLLFNILNVGGEEEDRWPHSCKTWQDTLGNIQMITVGISEGTALKENTSEEAWRGLVYCMQCDGRYVRSGGSCALVRVSCGRQNKQRVATGWSVDTEQQQQEVITALSQTRLWVLQQHFSHLPVTLPLQTSPTHIHLI